MPRIKLDESDVYRSLYERKLVKSDLNYAGHLGNDSLVTILQESRIDLFRELGFTELDLGDGRTGLIIGDLVINFKSECFEDDVLQVETGIGELKPASMRLFYRVGRKTDGKLIALAETGVVAFDYGTRKPGSWPDEFLKRLDGTVFK